MLRPALRIPRVRLAPGPRQQSIHTMPKLPHNFTQGVPGLLSADGFDMAWSQYMQHTLDKLNALTEGTELEDRDTKQILHATARDPDQAPVFNHASMAHNTHFFFRALTPSPKPMPETLQRQLTTSFSSIETLRRELTLTAASMFGPGFVWLVKTSSTVGNTPSMYTSSPGGPIRPGASTYGPSSAGEQEYKVLTTYLAGSPYPGAHWRQQSTDMNTVGANGTAAPYIRNAQRALTPNPGRAPGGLEVIPLLCLSTWEHTWLRDYGVGGKKAFAEAWWDSIDWSVVSDLASIRARPTRA
ncbi:superoxide dismutase [Plectosphaerella plurivora]|uniref:Superoxide dismutase n=1 Tax=Plectosphaerella plurivora TaxID=936078 RepID=A0A9P8VA37_9PEZI|nr:superoxide dismutase [Plectosphaerella plurivora]